MGFQSLNTKTVIYYDDFIAQLANYQAHSSGSINRIWRAISGKSGIAQLQANNGYNSLRHNPNSLFVSDSKEFILSASVAIVRNTGNQVHYIGLMDKHLGELPVLNGCFLEGSTATGNWKGYLYRNGVLLDSGVVASLANNEIFQNITITAYNGKVVMVVNSDQLTLTGQTDFAVGLCFGLSNSGVSWPSFLIDWVKMEV